LHGKLEVCFITGIDELDTMKIVPTGPHYEVTVGLGNVEAKRVPWAGFGLKRHKTRRRGQSGYGQAARRFHDGVERRHFDHDVGPKQTSMWVRLLCNVDGEFSAIGNAMGNASINSNGVEVGVMLSTIWDGSRRGKLRIEKVTILMDTFTLRVLAVGVIHRSTSRTIFGNILLSNGT